MKRLFSIFATIALLVACTEGGTDDNGQTPNPPKPQPNKTEINLDTTSLDFVSEGGEEKITFTTNEAWTAKVINTRADGWCSISPTSGAAGSATITVTTEPNDTPDDRSASIVIEAGSVSKTVKVSQKQKDALTVTASTFEVGAEGGEVKIEVKANIDFEYAIDPKAEEWISYEGTRAMKTSTLTFSVDKNDDTEKREGKIYIQSGAFNEEITIYQEGEEPSIVISQNEYVVAAAGETIAIDVTSNVDVTVELPSDVDWISENTTRATSTNTYYFNIQPNEDYDQRSAEIKFTNNESGLSEVVIVTQIQKDALVVAKDSYTVSSEGDQIEIEVGHNVDFDIEISADWIKKAQNTRAFVTDVLVFDIAANTSDDNREGTITFKSKDGELTQTVKVYQKQEDTIIVSTKEVVLEPEAGTFTVEIQANVEFSAFLPLVNWIREIEPTRSMTSHTLYYEYDVNPSAEPRETFIEIVNNETGDYEVITVVQKGAEIDEGSYTLVGTGKWTDDIVASLFGFSAPTYDVEVYENPATPGFIYLKDLYTNAYADVLVETFGIDASDIPTWDTSYFAIDISDPEAVNIPEQSIGLDLGYGEMYTWSLESGTYKDGVISFPVKGLVIGDDDGTSYANKNGKTKLDMNEEEIPDNPDPGEDEEDTYELMGIGKWTDDIIAPIFGVSTATYDVEVYENPATPGVIYLKDLYTNAYKGVLENSFGIDASDIPTWETSYFAIDISDPAAVNITYQPTGLNLGYGNMCIWSLETGKLENGILTFPTRGLAIDLPDDGAYYANQSGKTRLVLPGYDNGLYESKDYSKDGEVKVLQEATKGKGIDIVFMGDAYSDRQIADGTYNNVMKVAMDKFFLEEPYKSFRDHFNVYSVAAVSKNEGYLTGIEETCFAGYFGGGTHVGGDDQKVFTYAKKAIGEERMDDALIVVMMNSTAYAGTCWMYYSYTGDWGNGVSISYFPVGEDDEALAQVLHHEAGGHGFSKLADEYAYEEMGAITTSEKNSNKERMTYGWFKNVDFTSNKQTIKWSHFLSDERYAGEGLGAYEGGMTYWSGVWRPTYNSIMRHNTDGFNAPSREAIYYRINKLAYGADWEYDYEEFVEWDARNRKAESRTVVPYRLDVPEDFVPLHPPVLVKSSWRDAKKSTHRMGTKSLTIAEQAKALSEQVRANAIAKANAVSKVGGKLQKVAGTPYKRPEAMTMQNNNFVVKGKKITATRK